MQKLTVLTLTLLTMTLILSGAAVAQTAAPQPAAAKSPAELVIERAQKAAAEKEPHARQESLFADLERTLRKSEKKRPDFSHA